MRLDGVSPGGTGGWACGADRAPGGVERQDS